MDYLVPKSPMAKEKGDLTSPVTSEYEITKWIDFVHLLKSAFTSFDEFNQLHINFIIKLFKY